MWLQWSLHLLPPGDWGTLGGTVGLEFLPGLGPHRRTDYLPAVPGVRSWSSLRSFHVLESGTLPRVRLGRETSDSKGRSQRCCGCESGSCPGLPICQALRQGFSTPGHTWQSPETFWLAHQGHCWTRYNIHPPVPPEWRQCLCILSSACGQE